MEQHELEAAIASGIFKGFLGLLALIFTLWLFSPLLIPLAFTAQIYAIEHWRKFLGGGIVGFVLLIVGWFLWMWLANSKLGHWFKSRLSDDSGQTSDSRVLLLYLGVGAGFFFLIFSFVSQGMARDLTFGDVFLLLGISGFSVLSVYLALRRSK